MGEMPEYVKTIQVAKYYGVSPMEVMEWPQYWIAATFIYMNAEHAAQEKAQQKQQKAANRKKGRK